MPAFPLSLLPSPVLLFSISPFIIRGIEGALLLLPSLPNMKNPLKIVRRGPEFPLSSFLMMNDF